MNAKYIALTKLIRSTLYLFQIASRTEPVAGAYCPGSYDLAVQGKKIAGMSQHWFRNRCGIHCVVTVASINVEEAPDVLAGAVNRFYRGAASPVRCQAAALTSLRLCDEENLIAVRNLASAVMNQLAYFAGWRGGTIRPMLQRMPAPAPSISLSQDH
jgi:lipoate-protein ligase A